MKKIATRTWILAGILFVVTTLVTWLLRVDITIAEETAGYWTIGDAAVYASAALLGGPLGALASALGSALADILAGQAIYAPASFVIKGLMALLTCFLLKRGESRDWLYLVKIVGIAGGMMTLLYFLYDLVLRGNYTMAALGLPFNLLQLIAGGVLGVPVLKFLRRPSYEKAPATMPGDEIPKRQLK